jgi:HEAT repeat protein
MKKRIIRISIGVLVGMFIVVAGVWLLSRTLGNHDTLYAYEGKSLNGWTQQLESHDAGASNQAYETLNRQIIPQLVDKMFHDTNDSTVRVSLIETLNGLPGVQINYAKAEARRSWAAGYLGRIGPPAKAVVPSLIQALKGSDAVLYEPAIRALGKIHSDPGVVIPLLIPYLTNDDLNDEAATALGNYGSLAKEAFPKILPLLHARDNDARAAARVALKQIDPEAAAKAGVK